MEGKDYYKLYNTLRTRRQFDTNDERDYQILTEKWFEPYKGSLYGSTVKMVASLLGIPEMEEAILSSLPGEILYDVFFYRDVLDKMRQWARVTTHGRICPYRNCCLCCRGEMSGASLARSN